MYQKKFMEAAIAEAREGINNGDGGPFGVVVVKDGEIVASGHNRVLKNNDSLVMVRGDQTLLLGFAWL